MRKDAAKGTMKLERFAEIVLKHSIWLMIAWWTGGAWVLYFNDAPTLVKQLITFQAPMIAYIWIGITDGDDLCLAGLDARAGLRLRARGRASRPRSTSGRSTSPTNTIAARRARRSKKANELRALGQPVGDCIDCYQCVAVCPTGIDIRNGSSSTASSAACIDACDTVMTKIGRETRLIGYDNDINIHRREAGKPPIYRIVRPRTITCAMIRPSARSCSMRC